MLPSRSVTIVILCALVFVMLYGYRTESGIRMGNYFFGESQHYNITLAEYGYKLSQFGAVPQQYTSYQLGRIAFIRGEFERALWYFDRELALYPRTDQAHYMKGLTYGYTNREFEGIEEFKIFVERHPENWPSRNDLAWLYFRIGAIEEAYLAIFPVTQTHAGTPWVENTYGTLLLNKGEYEKAIEAFTRGLATLDKMSESQWGVAYPGNDPRVYKEGLEEMKQSFRDNIELAQLHRK